MGKPLIGKNNIYIAMYNPCVYESDFGVISLHYTQKGAEKAVDKKKKEEKKNHRGGIIPDWVIFKISKRKILE